MSWGGILERIQIDAVELLSNPVDSAKLERRYVLALASLLDEETAMQVFQSRKQAGWCCSWLCTLTKNFSAQHQQLREQTQQSCIQLDQLLNDIINDTNQRANHADDDASTSNKKSIVKRNNNNNNTNSSFQQQTLALYLKTSFCCSDRCKATLKILIQRCRDFDPSSPEVAQALFKIFPNAEKGLSSFVAATSSADGDLIPSHNIINASISKNNAEKLISSPAPETSSFQIKEKGVIASSGGNNNNNNNSAALRMNMQMTSDGVLSLFGNSVFKNNGNNSNQQRSATSSLLFTALDPRISVVVLADLLLPSFLKQKWTLQFGRLRSSGHPVQQQLQQKWIDACFGKSDGGNSSKVLDGFLKKCDNFCASQPPNALEILIRRYEQQQQQPSKNNKNINISSSASAAPKVNQEEVKNENSRFRARSMAYDILNSLIIEETKRAALLLRFETELPPDFREKIEEFTELSALPIPIPYEDSKDTWLLFVVMLFIVNAVTDPRFGAMFLENASAVKDVFEAFCIDDAGGRGVEMLEAFFSI